MEIDGAESAKARWLFARPSPWYKKDDVVTLQYILTKII
jgi:hypothetical protein